MIDGAQALALTSELVPRIAAGAVDRDRSVLAPTAELDALAASGLLTIRVPRTHGGPGLGWSTVSEVLRRIAVADPSVAQMLVSHFVFHDIVGAGGGPELRETVFADVLAGARIGNASSERGTAHAFEHRTTARRAPDGTWTVDGIKHYATGALGARWIGVLARREDRSDHLVTAFVRLDDEGVDLRLEEWAAFGQRATFSGTIAFSGVRVRDQLVLDPGPPTAERGPSVLGATDLLLHAAIDVGIGRAALQEGAAFVRERSRPRIEAGLVPVGEEPMVLQRFGALDAQVRALEALLDRAAQAVDTALKPRTVDAEQAAAASLDVAAVKALAQDVSVEASSAVLELAGASSTDTALGLDRHWRNVRAHSLHDPARWKLYHLGNHLVHGALPPRDQLI